MHPHSNLFSLSEIRPGVFHLQMGNRYDLAMHFLRYQEYYESPKWRMHNFTLLEFMEWYAKEYGKGAFTYPVDWKGFNIPDWAILSLQGQIRDFNFYDSWMLEIAGMIQRQGGKKFYLIGTCSQDQTQTDTLKHELAHAYFYLHPKYQEEMLGRIRGLGGTYDDRFAHNMQMAAAKTKGALLEMGYHPEVVEDETQAYFATGPCKELEDIITPEIQKYCGNEFWYFDQEQEHALCPTPASASK